MYCFTTFSEFVRTYHNTACDKLSRESLAVIEAIAQEEGSRAVDVKEAREAHLRRGWACRALVWGGDKIPKKPSSAASCGTCGRAGHSLSLLSHLKGTGYGWWNSEPPWATT